MAKVANVRGLKNYIQEIRNCSTKEQEKERVDKELGKVRKKYTSDKAMSDYDKRKYMWKLLYTHMLGYEIDFGHKQAMDLIASSGYAEKQVGYVACSIFLNEQDEFLRLVINSVRNDLISRNETFQCLAFDFVSNVGGAEFSQLLTADVIAVLGNGATRPAVRKKAALCLLRLLRKSPPDADLLPPEVWGVRLATLLEDRDLGVSLGLTTLLLGVVSRSYAGFEPCVPRVVAILERCRAREVPQDYTYYGLASPWLQTKCLRVLQYFPPPADPALLQSLTALLKKILSGSESIKNVNKNNAVHAIVFEALSLALGLGDPDLLALGAALLARFLSVREPNLRYLALVSLTRLAAVPVVADALRRHSRAVRDCLRDPDVSVARAALDLLFAAATPETARDAARALLAALPGAPAGLRGDLVLRAALLAERGVNDAPFYVDAMLSLLALAGDATGGADLWQSLVQFVTSAPGSQAYAAARAVQALRLGRVRGQSCPDALLRAAGHLLGEYAALVDPGAEATAQGLGLVEALGDDPLGMEEAGLMDEGNLTRAEPGSDADAPGSARSAQPAASLQRGASNASRVSMGLVPSAAAASHHSRAPSGLAGGDLLAGGDSPEGSARAGPASPRAPARRGPFAPRPPAQSPRATALEIFELLHAHFHGASPGAQAMLLTAYAKLGLLDAGADAQLGQRLEQLFGRGARLADSELQQRAVEYAALLPRGGLAAEALAPLPAWHRRGSLLLRRLAARGDAEADEGGAEQPAWLAERDVGGAGEGGSAGIPGSATSTAAGSARSRPADALPDLLDLLGEEQPARGGGEFGTELDLAGGGLAEAQAQPRDLRPGALQSASSRAASLQSATPQFGTSHPSSPHPSSPHPSSPHPSAPIPSSPIPSPPHPSSPHPDPSYRRLCLGDQGVLYEDDCLQIGVKSSFAASSGTVVFYLGNKTQAALQDVRLDVTAPSGAYLLSLGGVPAALEPRRQLAAPMQVTCLAPPLAPPQVALGYRSPGGAVVHRLLPLALPCTKFCAPVQVPQAVFEARWGQVAGPPFKLAAPLADAARARALVLELPLSPVPGVADAFACVLSLGVAPGVRVVPCMMRLQAGQLEVVTADASASRSLLDTLVALV